MRRAGTRKRVSLVSQRAGSLSRASPMLAAGYLHGCSINPAELLSTPLNGSGDMKHLQYVHVLPPLSSLTVYASVLAADRAANLMHSSTWSPWWGLHVLYPDL